MQINTVTTVISNAKSPADFVNDFAGFLADRAKASDDAMKAAKGKNAKALEERTAATYRELASILGSVVFEAAPAKKLAAV